MRDYVSPFAETEMETVQIRPLEQPQIGMPNRDEIEDHDLAAFVATMVLPQSLSVEEEFEENFVDLCWEGVL